MAATYNHITSDELDSFKLSAKLCHYWDTKNAPRFVWEVVDLPAFLAFRMSKPDNNAYVEVQSQPLCVKTIKLRLSLSSELMDDLKVFSKIDAKKEAEEILFKQLTTELEFNWRNRLEQLETNSKTKLFFFRVLLTPTIYDPATFCPRKGIMVRLAWQNIEPGERLIGGEFQNDKISKHNFSDSSYQRYGLPIQRWDGQEIEPQPQVILTEEEIKQHELKMRIRAIKEKMGYVLEYEEGLF